MESNVPDADPATSLTITRIGPSGSDSLGSALLMYTTEPLPPSNVNHVMESAYRLMPRWGQPGATRVDLSPGARDAILRSPLIHLKDDDRDPERFTSSSPPWTVFGIPIHIDPALPTNVVVFRDRQGNPLHTMVLTE